ncbi:MAG: hypothetical protein LQ346_004997 [Caloplaca aetnensis]|nr:MAG: hypothetical protein LQ346_004997 [Caloplaca aetnensis]
MASPSSLPGYTAGRNAAKPAREPLNTESAHGSVDTLRFRRRATTDVGPPPLSNLFGRRSKTGNQRSTPLEVSVLPLPHQSHSNNEGATSIYSEQHLPLSQPQPVQTYLLDEQPSAPITIPIRKTPASRPVTPLTGRVPSFFAHSPKQSHTPPQRKKSKDFTPSPDSPSNSSQSSQEVFAHSPLSRRIMRPDRGGPSAMYTPSSPLSPTMAAYSPSILGQQNGRAHSANAQGRVQPVPLAIPLLPPFHPANYESRKSTPRNARPINSAHGRQVSDAQKKLHKYQRELVINATRTFGGSTTKSPLPRPTSPRLNPLGSPGPVTPLRLEGESDYFLAGCGTASPSASKDSERSEMVERLIAVERDRLARPERPGHHSPTISPAGGPG